MVTVTTNANNVIGQRKQDESRTKRSRQVQPVATIALTPNAIGSGQSAPVEVTPTHQAVPYC